MKKYLPLLVFLAFLIPHQAHATAYYIDFVNGNDANAGTATTSSWQSISKFTANARTAGDIAFIRRGVASTTNVSNISFTSDGTRDNPLIVEADYDNLWSGFATSSQTYTTAVGSTTLTASASQSDIVAGNWIYVAGDCFETYSATAFNNCEYAYEVRQVTTTNIVLFLPYQGPHTGSGNSLRILPSAPQHSATNIAAGTLNFGGDEWWLIKGIDLRANTSLVTFDTATNVGQYFYDMDLTNNGSTGFSFGASATGFDFMEVNKSRFVGNNITFNFGSSVHSGRIVVRDSTIAYSVNLFADQTVAVPNSHTLYLYNTTITGPSALLAVSSSNKELGVFMRNVKTNQSPLTFTGVTSDGFNIYANVEDYNGTIGDNRTFNALSTSATQSILASTSTVLRSGGGPSSQQVVPSSLVSSVTNWSFSRQQLFEYPIYTDTSSKTYTIYVMSTSTSAWTANPTRSELWIECDEWASLAGAATTSRATIKSTGTVNFAASSAWQSLSVTCQPSQSGILYLRGWYAKTKEASKMNEFYVDGTPIIN